MVPGISNEAGADFPQACAAERLPALVAQCLEKLHEKPCKRENSVFFQVDVRSWAFCSKVVFKRDLAKSQNTKTAVI